MSYVISVLLSILPCTYIFLFFVLSVVSALFYALDLELRASMLRVWRNIPDQNKFILHYVSVIFFVLFIFLKCHQYDCQNSPKDKCINLNSFNLHIKVNYRRSVLFVIRMCLSHSGKGDVITHSKSVKHVSCFQGSKSPSRIENFLSSDAD